MTNQEFELAKKACKENDEGAADELLSWMEKKCQGLSETLQKKKFQGMSDDLRQIGWLVSELRKVFTFKAKGQATAKGGADDGK